MSPSAWDKQAGGEGPGFLAGPGLSWPAGCVQFTTYTPPRTFNPSRPTQPPPSTPSSPGPSTFLGRQRRTPRRPRSGPPGGWLVAPATLHRSEGGPWRGTLARRPSQLLAAGLLLAALGPRACAGPAAMLCAMRRCWGHCVAAPQREPGPGDLTRLCSRAWPPRRASRVMRAVEDAAIELAPVLPCKQQQPCAGAGRGMQHLQSACLAARTLSSSPAPRSRTARMRRRLSPSD